MAERSSNGHAVIGVALRARLPTILENGIVSTMADGSMTLNAKQTFPNTVCEGRSRARYRFTRRVACRTGRS